MTKIRRWCRVKSDFTFGGTPYLKEEWPWGRTKEKKLETYNYMKNAGVVVPGSNIWHDKFGYTVDTNVWLLRAELFNDKEIQNK